MLQNVLIIVHFKKGENMSRSLYKLVGTLAMVGAVFFTSTAQAELTGTVTATNNYLWRGLSQSRNLPAVQGGAEYSIGDYYVGTWVSNVDYAENDRFSYEHDMYFGKTGEIGSIAYDVGYLYYNYDKNAEFDFSEVYGSISVANLDLSLYVLVDTEAWEGANQDFGFGEATYVSADYTIPLSNGVEVGLHAGHHQGDFVTAFNGTPDSYSDYNVSASKDNFTFLVSKTNLNQDTNGAPNDNDETKIVVSYTLTF